jgi:hypothetical protein
MTALDYFLYDNRTPSSQWGRDWGIKAATGVLATRGDLRSDFSRYCGAMPADHGLLRGFGAALGGFRPATGPGYLLCVTLESSDHAGRPSWAVVGMWCPDPVALQEALTADPIGSARTTLSTPAPPAAIRLLPASATIPPRRRKSAGTTYHRFDPATTPANVIAILLGAIRSKTALPNVLGISAASRLAAAGQPAFDIVYGHPLDERTERILTRQLSAPDVLEDGPWPGATGVPEYGAVLQSRYREPASGGGFIWPLLVGSIVASVFAFYLINGSNTDDSPAGNTSLHASEVAAGVPTEEPSAVDAQNLRGKTPLQEMKQLLADFRELDPKTLCESRGFTIAEKTQVLPEYQEKRRQVQKAFATLISVRERMLNREGRYVAYYLEEEGARAPDAMEKIAEILDDQPLGGEACTVLVEAFAFEFQDRNATVSRWCDAIGRLERTARPASDIDSPALAPATAPPSAVRAIRHEQ